MNSDKISNASSLTSQSMTINELSQKILYLEGKLEKSVSSEGLLREQLKTSQNLIDSKTNESKQNYEKYEISESNF
jgi:hypothetical protein